MGPCVLGWLKSKGKKKSLRETLVISICIYIFALNCAFASEYNIKVGLPRSEVHNVTVSVTVPQGIVYQGRTITGASTSPSESFFNRSQEMDIYWNFGDVDNSMGENITIALDLLMSNLSWIQAGISVPDIRAILRYEDIDCNASFSYNESGLVSILEPDLDLAFTGTVPKIQLGEIASYTATISHSAQSNADAFDVDFVELLPSGLEFVRIVSCNGDYQSNLRGFSCNYAEIPLGTSEIITFEASLISTTTSDHINTVNLTWASAPSGSPYRRDGSDGIGGLNDYFTNATDRLTRLNFKFYKYDSPDPVISGDELEYYILVDNLGSGGTCFDILVNETYDENTTFLSWSANPTPSEYTNNSWLIKQINPAQDIIINVTVRVDKSLPNGTLLENKAWVSSVTEGGYWENSTVTTVICPNISIEKNAYYENHTLIDEENGYVQTGDKFYYNITLRNVDLINATNVTVTDIMDAEIFDNITEYSHEPDPSSSGNILFWNASVLDTIQFNLSEQRIINISVDLTGKNLSSVTKLNNTYKFNSNELDGEYKTLWTNVNHTLTISKVADKETCSPGDLVNYTITYCNSYANRIARNVTIYDILPVHVNPPGVEYVGASPPPTNRFDNILFWDIGDLAASASGSIKLTVRIKERPEVFYEGNKSVSGEGYVFSRKWFSTHYDPYSLVNYVNITADFDDGPSETTECTAVISVLDPGTEIKTVEHGSGYYESDEIVKYNRKIEHDIANESEGINEFVGAEITISRNKSIEIYQDMLAKHYPTTFGLPRNRSVNYTSRWSADTSAKNRVTGASLHESYRYATLIDRESHFKLDENGSLMQVDSQFEGVGHIGILKRDPDSPPQTAPAFQLIEDYTGSFSIVLKNGTEMSSEKSVSGEGFVATDTRIGESQRTYEYGTGSYEMDEIVGASENAIYKDMKAVHKPTSFKLMDSNNTWINSSIKWEEATRSKTEGVSYIGEQIQGAGYIYADIEARGLNELHTDTNFSGTARYRAILENDKEQHEVDVVYSGKYQVTNKILFTGVPRYDHPHLSASKVAIQDPNSTIVKYLITITNDGNKPLAPIYVRDTFPRGTSYINSSLRPSELTSSYANWTLLHLSIGSNFTIELNLDVVDEPSNLVNIVEASGQYNDQWISASDISVIEYDWLSCCPVEIRVSKTAAIDPSDPNIIWYNITVDNLDNYTMVADITDKLPEGLKFINSSISPASYGPDYVNWTITDLSPGGDQTIVFRAEATKNGTFMNRVHVDAYAIDGSDFASADALATVVIGPGGQTSTEKILGWEIPDWDLNYTDDLADLDCEEWCLLFDEEV
jgi:uncharacterized repeat protein (TIGR01451 family)